MPKYFYTAKSLKGESKSGTLEAKGKYQLAKTLRNQGLILIEAKSISTASQKKKWWEAFLNRVSLEEKMFFTRNLQVMIGAGLSLPRTLDSLANQSKNKNFKKNLLDIKEKITKGTSFSDALACYPEIFSELFRNMIKVGEEAGTLEQVLKTLTLQMERQHKLSSKVKGAMLYPAVIITAMLGIGVLMLVMVVPKISKILEDLNIELPMTTQFIIGLTDFLITKWYLVILILVFFLFSFWQFIKNKKGKEIIDAIFLQLPFISPIIKKTNSAFTVRTLSSLIASGIPIVRSLEIVSETMGNVHYKNALKQAAEKVKKGEKLSEALKPYEDIYPLTVIQMIAVGEETGETSGILAKLADFFEEEVNRITDNFSSVIEPILMIVVGIAVGFFAVSMLQPMYSILGGI